MIYYTFQNPIDGNKILNDIQKLVNKFGPAELSNKVLIIKLENITQYEGDSLIPKLEHKELS